MALNKMSGEQADKMLAKIEEIRDDIMQLECALSDLENELDSLEGTRGERREEVVENIDQYKEDVETAISDLAW